jgi:hypothetical protein
MQLSQTNLISHPKSQGAVAVGSSAVLGHCSNLSTAVSAFIVLYYLYPFIILIIDENVIPRFIPVYV